MDQNSGLYQGTESDVGDSRGSYFLCHSTKTQLRIYFFFTYVFISITINMYINHQWNGDTISYGHYFVTQSSQVDKIVKMYFFSRRPETK